MSKFICDLCKKKANETANSWYFNVEDSKFEFIVCEECDLNMEEQLWLILADELKKDFKRKEQNDR